MDLNLHGRRPMTVGTRALMVAIVLWGGNAVAGVPECGGIRLEDVQSCEIRGDLRCRAGCDDVGVYKKACATKLHTVCRNDCTLLPEPVCTDECTETCSEECTRGVPITCIHNCFRECAGSCDLSCADAENPENCMASCKATCDGECDIQCGAVVDASCYQHCVECCGGSCRAQANMSCQRTCQEQEFESCEYELKLDCSASCSGDGALFCDGEYILSASDVRPCATALIARGYADIDLSGKVSIGGGVPETRAGCRTAPGGAAGGSAAVPWFLVLGWVLSRRFRRAAPSNTKG